MDDSTGKRKDSMASESIVIGRLKPLFVYGIPVLIAAFIKLLVWSPSVTPFNADEAIVALMARHINQGQVPIFFYGQYYMGSLDALIVAQLFRFFGESVQAIRIVQCVLYLGTVFTTSLLAKKLLDSYRAALYAGLLAAVPSVNVTLYTTVSLGGYGEMLLIGNLLLLGGLGIIEEIREPGFVPGRKYYLGIIAWGLGAGFAFWVIGLSLVYSIPVLGLLAWHLRKTGYKNLIFSGLVLLIAGVVGSAPWWSAGILAGNSRIFSELAGGAIAGVNPEIWLLKPLQRILNLLIFGGSVVAGLRPPWDVTWLMLPLLPFALLFWLVVLISSIKSLTEKGRWNLWLPAGLGVVLAVGFVFSPYGDDPSGRYFVPLMLPLAIFAADMVTRQMKGKIWYEVGLISFVLVYNLGATFQARTFKPPGFTTQFDQVAQINQSYTNELLDFLKKENIRAGYSNYWVSYPVNFLSGEEIIFSPRLPYHLDFRYTERDDRYPAYTELVRSAGEVAYITTRHPPLDSYLREQFAAKGISWMEKSIGDYTVYYALSAPVTPEEIGLGVTTQP